MPQEAMLQQAMPQEIAIVIAAIIAVFCLFAGVLAYAEYRTRGLPTPRG